MTDKGFITITGASEHNLHHVSVKIPHNRLTVVTGVSGSGKSSLVFDVLYREAESRYLGAFTSYARQFMGRMKRPDVDRIEGLLPAVAVDQRPASANPRSTVGTVTGIWDALRLLYARIGEMPGDPSQELNRSLFSFNTAEGACPECKGLGVEDRLDPELLVDDGSKTLREGALVITAPNGYIIYSQVTLDVLDQVCRSEGFHIDIPWRDLTPEQKHIVLYGSEKIEIPYGKHPLESRMKWSGITAKPREMGYYKGILPVMETILKRDRNRNILRFVRTGPCGACGGRRLNPLAQSVRVGGYGIADLTALQLDELAEALQNMKFDSRQEQVASLVIASVTRQVELLRQLGLSYLTADRASDTLSPGETQRLRLAGLATIDLGDMLCIFDEPSVGLHPSESAGLISVLKAIRDRGNTVVVVEHDEDFMRQADWLIDIGPGPGEAGGTVLFCGTLQQAMELSDDEARRSRTLSFLRGLEELPEGRLPDTDTTWLTIEQASARNLQRIDVSFRLHSLNVVTGVSGAGKTTLVDFSLGAFLRNRLNGDNEPCGQVRGITGWETVRKVITIDQSPIGRTPRSNPATYTGLFDHIRDLFAKLPESVARGYGKSRFSFNTAGGRCETCEGAGYQQTGMHFMGSVDVPCESCEGRRFDNETLEVEYRGKNISSVLAMPVSEARAFFSDEKVIAGYLEKLESLGLGYLTLGQRSSTLSGGEAQRVKLAAELSRPALGHTLYIMEEPTTGLHNADVGVLLEALRELVRQGHTVIVTEHHAGLIRAASHVVDLGPGSGREGGRLVYSGAPEGMGEYRISNIEYRMSKAGTEHGGKDNSYIIITGATTNNLRNVDIRIPKNKVTVLTGVSGSGKSSLAFDTLFAEGHNRFLESFSPYVRSRLGVRGHAGFAEIRGMTPPFAVGQSPPGHNPRSTLGTITGLYDHYRLLFSRYSTGGKPSTSSSLFSFNHHLGACPACSGLGTLTVCDPERLVTHPAKALHQGALDGTKTGKFYGDPDGQYIASLFAAADHAGLDLSGPWSSLSPEAQELAMNGTGDRVYEVVWQYRRGSRSGEHRFTGPWQGFAGLVNEEYARKHADHRGEAMLALMKTVPCPSCAGSRLRPEALAYRVEGETIAGLSSMQCDHVAEFFRRWQDTLLLEPVQRKPLLQLVGEILRRLETLCSVGLAYLTADRPSASLSEGESRRARLAAQIGSGLTGITYILDEPSVGLGEGETEGLMTLVRSLQQAGNTVVMVEHDPVMIEKADHVIEIGPGAGREGGLVVAEGTPDELMQNPASLTGAYLASDDRYPDRSCPAGNAGPEPGEPIPFLRNVNARNLKGFDLSLPVQGVVIIDGVAGSGRSTLLFEVIQASLEAGRPAGCEAIGGFERYNRVVAVRQRSGFQSSAGTPVTYTGLFDHIRNLFASLPEAKAAGFGKNAFSFLSAEGRCPTCEGAGYTRVSMDFLPDLKITCEQCGGKRFREGVLSVSYRGRNIAAVLEMTVAEAMHYFEKNAAIVAGLEVLRRTGLGYLTLGQSLDSLSGGESQRLALAAELIRPAHGPALWLLEEPTAGLGYTDIKYLMDLLCELGSAGNLLLVADSDPLAAKYADIKLTLGPGAGDKGGYLVG